MKKENKNRSDKLIELFGSPIDWVEFYRSIFENSPVGIAILDIDSNILAINKSMLEITGLSDWERGTKLSISAVESLYSEALQKDLYICFKSGKAIQKNTCIVFGNSNSHWVRLNLSPILNQENQVIGGVVLLEDINEIVTNEIEIKQLNAILKALREINKLISHEKDFIEVLQGACDIINVVEGVEGCSIGIYDSYKHSLSPVVSSGFNCKITLNKGEVPPCISKVILTKKPLIVIGEDKYCAKCPNEWNENVGSSIIIPLISVNKLRGVLFIWLNSNHQIGSEQTELFVDVSDDLAFAVDRFQAQEALMEIETRYKQLYANSPIALAITTKDGQLLEANKAHSKLTGYTPEQFKSKHITDIYSNPEDRDRIIAELKEHGKITNEEVTFVRKDGTKYIALLNMEGINISGKRCFIASLKDITARVNAEKQLRESERLRSLVLEKSPIGIVISGPECKIRYVNPIFEKMTGYNCEELAGIEPPYPFWPAESAERIEREFFEALDSRKDYLETWFRRKNGLDFLARISPVCVKVDEEIDFYFYTAADITEERRIESALRKASTTDPLTDLFNSGYAHDMIEKEIQRARRSGNELTLLFLDLDHFKKYNDRYGHLAGDQMLADIGKAIKRTVRVYDVPCRYGGDEFLVILPGESRKPALKVIDRLQEAVNEASHDEVTVSIGLACLQENWSSTDLLKAADKDMYRRKIEKRRKRK